MGTAISTTGSPGLQIFSFLSSAVIMNHSIVQGLSTDGGSGNLGTTRARRGDVLTVPDTGIGVAPIVDRGAYERQD